MKRVPLRFLSVALCCLSIACGSDNGGDPVDTGVNPNRDGGPDGGIACMIKSNFTSIHTNLLNTPTCNPDGICHGTGNPPNGGLNFKLTKDMVHADLLANSVSPTRMGMYPKRIVPMMPDQSLIFFKIQPNTNTTERMPLGGSALDPCIVEAIRAWIAAGAAND